VLSDLLNDLRYGARVLRRTPAFTCSAALALALGIGANSAMFSVVDAMLLHPLHFPEPERLVSIYSEAPKSNMNGWPASEFDLATWQRENRVFENLSGHRTDGFNAKFGKEPEYLHGALVSANYFDMLKVRPALGRVFRAGEDQKGHEHEMVISHGLWERRFGGDPSVIGKPFILNGESYTLIGVQPQSMQRFDTEELWVPLVLDTSGSRASHDDRATDAMGRLKPGISLQQAQADMDPIAARLSKLFPDTNQALASRVASLEAEAAKGSKPLLIALWGAVGFVLLIACANVANLLLVKASGRRREIAIRLALGASRFGLIQQLLVESTLLAIAGGAVGLLPTLWGVGFISRALDDPSTVPTVDSRVLLYTLAISLATGLLFGLLPALVSTRAVLSETLKQAGSRSIAAGGNRTRNALVIAETALALLLLIGAGLMLKSLARLRAVDPGFDPSNVLTMQMRLPDRRYPTPEKQRAFYHGMLERVQAIPGVQAAGMSSSLPLIDSYTATDVGLRESDSSIATSYDDVSPGYFQAMRIRVLAGRGFTEADSDKAPLVAIVNDKFARKYWPKSDPIGKRFHSDDKWWTVVGRTANVLDQELRSEQEPTIYFPYSQYTRPVASLAVRASAADMTRIAQAIRSAILAVDPNQAVYDIRPMRTVIARSLNGDRITSALCAVFAGIALMLASIGIYGVVSFLVTERTREIGIRMALGAQRGDVSRLVIGRGMWLVLAGLAIGLMASAGATQLLAGELYGVKPLDPSIYLGLAAFLGTVALAANYLPARRAARVDPMIALREE
jgi:putative ABC transport system permease protein